jgi:hypothetical protein
MSHSFKHRPLEVVEADVFAVELFLLGEEADEAFQ